MSYAYQDNEKGIIRKYDHQKLQEGHLYADAEAIVSCVIIHNLTICQNHNKRNIGRFSHLER